MLSFGPDVRLSCTDVETVAVDRSTVVHRTDAASEALRSACDALDALRDDDVPIYGVTTGFGPLVDYASADPDGSSHAEGLLAHLATGSGRWASPPVVRATIAARLQSLAQGHSALDPTVFDALAGLLDAPWVPAVPEIGSLGASGDLTPLAHVARVLTGSGRVVHPDGSVGPADSALDAIHQTPLALSGRDALALVNGTAFMTAYAALAVARAERLVHRAEQLTGWAYRLLGCPLQALDARLHNARGHTGQVDSARAIRDAATRDGTAASDARPLQEVYSLRCAPQILGAVRDQLDYVRRITVSELNGVNDNPVIVSDDTGPAALHGGNFQGQQIAFAADALNAALTQVGVLAERQVDVLLTPSQNGGAPPLLAWRPGETSGLAGAQLTATALVAEMRHATTPSATASIPTNQDNQDVVSMGALAARAAYGQTDPLASILAVLGMALAQLTHLREAGRAEGASPPSPPDWMPPVEAIVEDRALHDEIDALATRWLAREA